MTSATLFDCPAIDQRGLLRPGDTPGTLTVTSVREFGARSVQPIDSTTGTQPITVTFTNIITPGVTSLTTSASGPQPPGGFSLGEPPTYYDLTTTTVSLAR